MNLKKVVLFLAMIAMMISFTGCPSKPGAETGSGDGEAVAAEEEPEDVVIEKMKAAEAEANRLVKENHSLRIEKNKSQRKLGMPTKQTITFEDEDGEAPKEEAKKAVGETPIDENASATPDDVPAAK